MSSQETAENTICDKNTYETLVNIRMKKKKKKKIEVWSTKVYGIQ